MYIYIYIYMYTMLDITMVKNCFNRKHIFSTKNGVHDDEDDRMILHVCSMVVVRTYLPLFVSLNLASFAFRALGRNDIEQHLLKPLQCFVLIQPSDSRRSLSGNSCHARVHYTPEGIK